MNFYRTEMCIYTNVQSKVRHYVTIVEVRPVFIHIHIIEYVDNKRQIHLKCLSAINERIWILLITLLFKAFTTTYIYGKFHFFSLSIHCKHLSEKHQIFSEIYCNISKFILIHLYDLFSLLQASRQTAVSFC